MTNITPGVQAYGSDFPPSAFDLDWTILSNVGSTTWFFGTPNVSCSFVAPLSGRVLVAVGCGVRNNAANAERLAVSYTILEDDLQGAEVVAPSLTSGVISNGTALVEDYHYVGSFRMEEGLQPGRGYFAGINFRGVTGGFNTVDIASRMISIVPLP